MFGSFQADGLLFEKPPKVVAQCFDRSLIIRRYFFRHNKTLLRLLPRRADALTWLLDPLVAVRGHISLAGHHLAGLGRLARASALLLMYDDVYHKRRDGGSGVEDHGVSFCFRQN